MMRRSTVFRLAHLCVMMGMLCVFGGVLWVQGCREHSSSLRQIRAVSRADAAKPVGRAGVVERRGSTPALRPSPRRVLRPVSWYRKGRFVRKGRRGQKKVKGCFPWRPVFLREGLMLTPKQRKAAIRAALGGTKPSPSAAQLRIARAYQRTLRGIQALRACVAREHRRRRGRRRRAYVRKARALIYALLNEVIMPIWLGTPWAFYGTAEVPHQKGKAIACGYFVLHALKGIGFVFPQSTLVRKSDGSTMRTYEFAKLPATSMMRLLSGPRYWKARGGPHDVKLWRKTLLRFGPGVYFLGLDTHVGLVFYDGKVPYFWHSSSWVAREPMYKAGDVLASKYRRLGYMSRRAVRMWLKRTPVVVPDGWYR